MAAEDAVRDTNRAVTEWPNASAFCTIEEQCLYHCYLCAIERDFLLAAATLAEKFRATAGGRKYHEALAGFFERMKQRHVESNLTNAA